MLSTPRARAEGQDTETATQSRDIEFAAQGLCDKTSSQFSNEVIRRDVPTRACTPVLHLLMQKDNSAEQKTTIPV